MNESSTLPLVRELTRSYSLQVELYKKLNAIVQKINGQLVLRRGDLSGVMGLFEEKQKLLNAITAERERTRESANSWRQQKAGVSKSAETERLDSVLAETQDTIKAFLESEQQLERYLKHLTGTANGSQT